MKHDKIIDYDLTIKDFLADVNDWLCDRIPNGDEEGRNIVRDDDEYRAVVDTLNMWRDFVWPDPYKYTQQNNLDSVVCNHNAGFIVKRGINKYDNSMWLAVLDVLMAFGKYQQFRGDNQKADLANAIKKYKILRAENIFERVRASVLNPRKLLSTRVR